MKISLIRILQGDEEVNMQHNGNDGRPWHWPAGETAQPFVDQSLLLTLIKRLFSHADPGQTLHAVVHAVKAATTSIASAVIAQLCRARRATF